MKTKTKYTNWFLKKAGIRKGADRVGKKFLFYGNGCLKANKNMKKIMIMICIIFFGISLNAAPPKSPKVTKIDIDLGFSIVVNTPKGAGTSCIPWLSICNITITTTTANKSKAIFDEDENSLTLEIDNTSITIEEFENYLSSNLFKIESYEGSLGYVLPNALCESLGIRIGTMIPNGQYPITHSEGISTIKISQLN